MSRQYIMGERKVGDLEITILRDKITQVPYGDNALMDFLCDQLNKNYQKHLIELSEIPECVNERESPDVFKIKPFHMLYEQMRNWVEKITKEEGNKISICINYPGEYLVKCMDIVPVLDDQVISLSSKIYKTSQDIQNQWDYVQGTGWDLLIEGTTIHLIGQDEVYKYQFVELDSIWLCEAIEYKMYLTIDPILGFMEEILEQEMVNTIWSIVERNHVTEEDKELVMKFKALTNINRWAIFTEMN